MTDTFDCASHDMKEDEESMRKHGKEERECITYEAFAEALDTQARLIFEELERPRCTITMADGEQGIIVFLPRLKALKKKFGVEG